MLPTDNNYLIPSLANDLPAAGDAAKAAAVLNADGWAKVGGKWTKGGQHIKLLHLRPGPLQRLLHRLPAHRPRAQRPGHGRHGQRHRRRHHLGVGLRQRHVRHRHPLEQPGPEPVLLSTTASWTAPCPRPSASPPRATTGATPTRPRRPAWPSSRAPRRPASRPPRSRSCRHIMSTQVPVAPLLYGGAWSETSTRNYTGWPTPANPYMSPQPTSPYLEYTVLHLKPVVLTATAGSRARKDSAPRPDAAQPAPAGPAWPDLGQTWPAPTPWPRHQTLTIAGPTPHPVPAAAADAGRRPGPPCWPGCRSARRSRC